jgi:hypothetical protein
MATLIMEHGRQPDGSVRIDPREARQAVGSVLAMLIEAEPVVDTEEKLREACMLAAAEPLIQVKPLREQFDLTGNRVWTVPEATLQ